MYMLAAYKSFHCFIENSYQSERANGRVGDALWIIIQCPLYFSRPFALHFSLEYDNSSERSVLRAFFSQ